MLFQLHRRSLWLLVSRNCWDKIYHVVTRYLADTDLDINWTVTVDLHQSSEKPARWGAQQKSSSRQCIKKIEAQ